MNSYHSFRKSFRLAIPALLLLSSCNTNYHILKSNRVDYQMNKDQLVDSTVIKTYLPYKAQLDREMNTVIGHSAVLMPKSDKGPENLLRNFFADALLHEALKYDPTIDFAMPSTKGGLRVDIPKGDIKLSNVFEVMPFENEMMVFTLNPADVQNLLNFIAATGGQPVANLSMKIVNDKPTNVMINGQPLDTSRTYKVLTSDYVASGGDNVQSFKTPIAVKTLGLKIRDALITYIKETEAAGKTINATFDGRITKD